MRRRTTSLRDKRAEIEAAEARGLIPASRPKAPTEAPRSAPQARPGLRIVWAVCDVGGRTVAKFPYPEKARAEALVEELKASGKGPHFVRSIKEPIEVR